MNTASSGSSWTSRLCYGKVCLCLTNALGRPLVSVSDFGTLGRISNLNAPATFLQGRKIRVIKYLMNIPQIFSKINPIVRDFQGLVHSWECSALPSSGGQRIWEKYMEIRWLGEVRAHVQSLFL